MENLRDASALNRERKTSGVNPDYETWDSQPESELSLLFRFPRPYTEWEHELSRILQKFMNVKQQAPRTEPE